MKLSASVALITGAASGFGKEFSLHILKNGGKVFAVDFNKIAGEAFEEECKEKYGSDKIKFQHCDVSNKEQLKESFEAATKTFNSLNVVCNNAGISGLDHPSTVADFSKNQIAPVIDIDLRALIEGTYLGINKMSKLNGNAGGVVINVASVAGLRVLPNFPVYTASKHGAVAFTHSFKFLDNHSSDGVRVNCLCPSFCATPILTGQKEFFEEIKTQVEFIDINDVTKAFSQCIEKEELNGSTLAILAHGNIVDVSIPGPTVPIE